MLINWAAGVAITTTLNSDMLLADNSIVAKAPYFSMTESN